MCLPRVSALLLPTSHLCRKKKHCSKEQQAFSSSWSKASFSLPSLSEIPVQPRTFNPPLSLFFPFKILCGAVMKSFLESEISICLNISQPPLIIHFTICWALFIITWAGDSFRLHRVGGSPFVSMHSICVGCLLASALLWMGHWKAQPPWLQSIRRRLVGASLQTACRQTHKQQPQCTNSAWNHSKREVWGCSTCSPLHWPLTCYQSVYIMSQMLWMRKQNCVGRGMSHQHMCINYHSHVCYFCLFYIYRNNLGLKKKVLFFCLCLIYVLLWDVPAVTLSLFKKCPNIDISEAWIFISSGILFLVFQSCSFVAQKSEMTI